MIFVWVFGHWLLDINLVIDVWLLVIEVAMSYQL